MRDGLPGASSLSIYITPLVVAANNRSVRLVTNFPYKIRPLVYIFREGFSFISIHLYKGETACPSVAGCTLSPASHLDKRGYAVLVDSFSGMFSGYLSPAAGHNDNGNLQTHQGYKTVTVCSAQTPTCTDAHGQGRVPILYASQLYFILCSVCPKIQCSRVKERLIDNRDQLFIESIYFK